MASPDIEDKMSFSIQDTDFSCSTIYDDDGRLRRTGTLVSGTAHVITAVIGSGVLSLAWAMAQLGWIGGPVSLLIFSLVTWFTSRLLADVYRYPDPVTGTRNHTYVQAVQTILGELQAKLCGLGQYANLIGSSIGYTITASISMSAIRKANCFHKRGHDAGCESSNTMFVIIFAVAEIILSQIPNFHKLTALSYVAASMSFIYSSIGLSLSIVKIAEGKPVETGLTGTVVGVDVTKAEKIWNALEALGNIAFAYAYSVILIEIQDTLKSKPAESKVMRKVATISTSVTTVFYMLCGVLGYAAFGNKAPGNFLTGFGFYEPFWLLDFANMCVVVHLVGAYQVLSQPVYRLVENWCSKRRPNSAFITKGYSVNIPGFGNQNTNMFRLLWRTGYVIFTALMAIIFPFFNNVLGLIGAFTFWPLTVYFPVKMHFSQAKVQKYSSRWIALMVLSTICFVVSLLAFVASIQGVIVGLRSYKPFSSIS